MKRSYFLSRRLHRRPSIHRHSTRKLRPVHRRSVYRNKRRQMTKRRFRHRGGIGETTGTIDGIPVSENALITNSKGMTRSVKNRISPLNDAETSEQMGDNDI